MRRRGTSWLFAALGREQNGLIDSLCIERTRRQEALFQGLPSPSLSILQTNERTDKRVREDRPTNHLFHPGCPSPTGCKHARRTCCRCEGLTHQPTNPVAEGGTEGQREGGVGRHPWSHENYPATAAPLSSQTQRGQRQHQQPATVEGQCDAGRHIPPTRPSRHPNYK